MIKYTGRHKSAVDMASGRIIFSKHPSGANAPIFKEKQIYVAAARYISVGKRRMINEKKLFSIFPEKTLIVKT